MCAKILSEEVNRDSLIANLAFSLAAVKKFALKYDVWFILVVLTVISGTISPVFFTFGNLINVLRVSSIIGCLAIGQTLTILTGGIDLSVGSLAGIASVISALACGGVIGGGTTAPGAISVASGVLYGKIGLFYVLCVTLAPVIMLGFVNGLMITKGKIPPLIVTLAMLSIGRGLVYVITRGEDVHVSGHPSLFFLGSGYLGPIPVPIIIWIGLSLGCYHLLTHRIWGRHIYAVGGNVESAHLSGINVNRITTLAYILSGLFAGVGGVILTARIEIARPTAGAGLELDCIAGVIMGGASFFGGEGSVIKTVVGIIILGVVINLMNLLNVSPYAQQTVKGAIIGGAVLARVLRKR